MDNSEKVKKAFSKVLETLEGFARHCFLKVWILFGSFRPTPRPNLNDVCFYFPGSTWKSSKVLSS